MTKTLEEIKGMNLQVGDKIEIHSKNATGNHKELFYYGGINHDKTILWASTFEGDSAWFGNYDISRIEDIKILEYKK